MRDGSEISGPGDKRESGGNRAERRTCAGSVHCVRSGAGKPPCWGRERAPAGQAPEAKA